MRGGRRELAATDIRKGYPALFHNRAAGDHARAPTAAFGPGPFIVDVLGLAVDFLDETADAILQANQVAPDEFGIHEEVIRRHPYHGSTPLGQRA